MQVQKLENLLGTALFDRTKKPHLLTDAGELAIEQIRNILRETEKLGSLMSEATEPAGRYRLGVIPTLSPTVLPLVLGAFVKKYPRVELVVEELKTSEIIESLKEDRLDAGLAATPLYVSGLHEEFLGLEEMFAYLPENDSLLLKKKLTQGELLNRDLWVMPEGHCFRTQVLSYCAESKATSSGPVHFESGNFQTLIRLVDQGLGATILPALVVKELSKKKQRLQVRAFRAPAPFREISLVRARDQLRRNVHDALVELIRESLKSALNPPNRSRAVLNPLDL